MVGGKDRNEMFGGENGKVHGWITVTCVAPVDQPWILVVTDEEIVFVEVAVDE